MDLRERPLRLLSLDGGGIRGLSSLYILKSIMTVVRSLEPQTSGDSLLYPCDYFDLIAGTSTGGLIAVMLGVLHMDIDSCIDAYIKLAPIIFPVESMISGSGFGKLWSAARGKQRFNPSPFEEAVKKLIADHLRTRSTTGKNTPLRFEAAEPRCKIFMCVTSEKLSRHFRFRNYRSPWDPTDDCAIWQACRATTAAPTFFPPMVIGTPPTAYVDGGFRYNNPIRALMEEVSELWLNRPIGCIISVGTGVPGSSDIGRTIAPLFETMKNMSLDTEKIAREFNKDMELRYPGMNVYFRFNVEQGLGQIGLEEWKEMDRTYIATRDYLIGRREQIKSCASRILNPSDYIFLNMNSIRGTPDSSVQFSRDPKFVKRDEVTKIEDLLKPSGWHNRAGLFGLGGIGKSQIAIEYSYIVREQSPKPWVFWVHASSATQFEQGFRYIAIKVGLPGLDDPRADIFQLVFNWLDNEQNGPWLLILDNADDYKFFFEPLPNSSGAPTPDCHRSIFGFIPRKPHGAILVTSRDRTSASALVGDDNCLVHLGPMDPPAALSLLRTKLSVGPLLEDEAAKLLAALEYIPLAITQAGAYIRQMASVMTFSISDYYRDFVKNQTNKEFLLNQDWKDFRRDPTVSNAVITTWQISFNQIQEHHRPAADLLSLMSLFNRQGIPDFLIQEDDDRLSFRRDIETLLSFSLINAVNSTSNLFDMHRLVQVATRKWLEGSGLLQVWKAKAIQRMAKSFPNGEYENWAICNVLLSHAEDVLLYDQEEKESKLQHALILENTAWYISARGKNKLAIQRREQSLKIRRQLLDQEDERITLSKANLASTYLNEGRWKEAEELQMHVMETRKKALGEEHPSTLTSIGNLASTYQNQGRWKEAERMEVQVMETSKRVLGEEHPSTLTSIANLASTFWNQGRYKEAELLGVQVMEKSKKLLGEEHPDTLLRMSNLASTYQNQGQWKEAVGMRVQVMETRKKVLGEEHPDTLTSMAHLASTFSNQGEWKEAEQLEVQVMETSKRVLGEEHPHTLIRMADLASIYRNQGRWKEAEGLDVQVMETSKKVLGEEHPSTLTSMANLASTFWNQGRWKEAEVMGVQVMETSKRVLGEEHPNTLTSMANLASTYRDQGRWKDAEELEVQVMQVSKKLLGQEHPNTLISMANIASTYRNQGRWKEAEVIEVQVMETSKKILGEEHPSTLISMANLASTYGNQERWKEAEEMEVQVMETKKRVLGEEHPNTLLSIANLAATYVNQRKLKEAEGLGVQVMETRKKVLGESHPFTLASMANLAITWKLQGYNDKALELMKECSKQRELILGSDHPDTMFSLKIFNRWQGESLALNT